MNACKLYSQKLFKSINAMKSINFGLFFFIFLLLSPATKAASEHDFYTAYASQVEYPELSKELIQDMILKMIVKTTGNKNLRFNAEVQKAIKKVNIEFVNRHQIIKDQTPYQHKVDISQSHLNDLLDSLNLIQWPIPRPLTIIWMVLENSSGEQTVISDRNILKTWENTLQKVEMARGVQFILPISSLLELQTIQSNQILSDNDNSFLKLSKAYPVKQSLIVVIKQQPQNWGFKWHFYGLDDLLIKKGQFYIEKINQGISRVADKAVDLTLLSEHSMLSKERKIFLDVSNVYTFEDYQKVKKSLFNSRWLKDAFLLAIEHSTLQYELITFGSGEEYITNLYAKKLYEWKTQDDEQFLQDFDSVSTNTSKTYFKFSLKNATSIESSP